MSDNAIKVSEISDLLKRQLEQIDIDTHYDEVGEVWK